MTQQSPRRRRLRPIHFVLSVALGLAMTLLGGLPAEASLGTIFGTVYDAASGLPAVGVTVIATGPDDVRESTVTDALGTYSIAPAYGYGDYDIQAGSSDYVWSPLASEAPRAITFDGSLGATDFTLHRGLPITGIVRDATDGITPLAGIVVGASDLADTQVYFDRATSPLIPGAPFGATGPDGLFSITVPLGADYDVVASDLGVDYDTQGYDHISLSSSGCACELTPVSAGAGWPSSPVTGIDFDLRRFADWTWVSVLTQTPGAVPYPGVLVDLDRYDTGTSTWDLDVDSTLSDAAGFADLYGLGGGDYRLRYSIGGVFTTVLVAADPGNTPYSTSDGGKVVDLPGLTAGAGCGCGFDETDVDLTFAAPSNGGSGGGTPAKPRKPHTVVTGFAGVPIVATPTPTPTPTPSPSASQSGDATPSPEPTGPATTTTALDLTWLWILVAIVLALIVVFFVIAFVRRRRP